MSQDDALDNLAKTAFVDCQFADLVKRALLQNVVDLVNQIICLSESEFNMCFEIRISRRFAE